MNFTDNGLLEASGALKILGPNSYVTDLYPTETIAAAGTSVARTSAAQYDFYTGLVTTATDVDNNVSTVTEYDALGRPTKVRNAANTALESWTRTEYDDVNRRVVVRSDIDAIGDGRKVATQFYDQLGRVRLAKTLEDAATQSPYNETDGIKVQTRYLTSGTYTYQLTSNPYRAATSTAETDATGNIVSRSDYMPYGEEITGLGGRSANDKYVSDDVRQGFTGYINDVETGLDFAQARIYSDKLGRFFGTDPLLSTGQLDKPQSWNRYSYVVNRPFVFVDPAGMYICTASQTQCEKFEAALQKAKDALKNIKDPKEFKKVERSLSVYGEAGVKNGVTVGLATKPIKGVEIPEGETQVAGTLTAKTKDNPTGQNIRVLIKDSAFDSDSLFGTIAHEGTHAADGADWIKSGFRKSMNPTEYQTEFAAFETESLVYQAAGVPKATFTIESNKPLPRFVMSRQDIWNEQWPSWSSVDMTVADRRKIHIDNYLEFQKGYELTEKSKKKAF